jgi:hypothetical protein
LQELNAPPVYLVKGHERPEAVGIWREMPDQDLREVIVRIGNAAIILTDIDDRPLRHWALAGIQVLEQDSARTVFTMHGDGAETLSISDRGMIDAIMSVSLGEIKPRGAPRRRRRTPRLLAAIVLLGAAGAAAAFGPEILQDQAIRIAADERTAELGDQMLIALMERTGRPCDEMSGLRALDRLAMEVAPEAPPKVRVMPIGAAPVVALPGQNVVLARRAVSQATAPEQIAGWIVLALRRNSLATLFRSAGPIESARYILTGAVGAPALDRAIRGMMTLPDPGEVEATARALEVARIRSAPFLAAAAAEGVPAPGRRLRPTRTVLMQPLLDDHDWAALKGVCG